MPVGRGEGSLFSVLPAVGDGDDAGAVLGDVEEHGHGEVEVRAGRVAPAAVVGGERVVWRAEVGGRDQDGGPPWPAPPPPGLLLAPDLEARAAAEPLVEQRRAQRRVVHAVPLAVQVAVPAGAACSATRFPFVSSAGRRFFCMYVYVCMYVSMDGRTYPWCPKRRCRRRTWRARSASRRRRRRTRRECGRRRGRASSPRPPPAEAEAEAAPALPPSHSLSPLPRLPVQEAGRALSESVLRAQAGRQAGERAVATAAQAGSGGVGRGEWERRRAGSYLWRHEAEQPILARGPGRKSGRECAIDCRIQQLMPGRECRWRGGTCAAAAATVPGC
jgi:hypothetical protein